jgi:hypothetical protein
MSFTDRRHLQTVTRGLNDRLVIQYKEGQQKTVRVFHNYQELESHCIHPTLFTHDVVNKETRLLFCLKNQVSAKIKTNNPQDRRSSAFLIYHTNYCSQIDRRLAPIQISRQVHLRRGCGRLLLDGGRLREHQSLRGLGRLQQQWQWPTPIGSDECVHVLEPLHADQLLFTVAAAAEHQRPA